MQFDQCCTHCHRLPPSPFPAASPLCRSIWLPGSSVQNPPDLVQSELYSSPASSEGWISLPPEMVATQPGQYLISITAFSGNPTAVLRVSTPSKDLQVGPRGGGCAAGLGFCCE